MRIIRHAHHSPTDTRGSVIALGNFDGIHLGHQAILKETCAIARQLQRVSALMTFEPHPRQFFDPQNRIERITPFRQKAQWLEHFGIEALFVLQFNHAFSQQSAKTFIEHFLNINHSNYIFSVSATQGEANPKLLFDNNFQ